MQFVRMGSTGTGVAALPRLHELRRHGRLDAQRGRQHADPAQAAAEAGINFFDTADVYSRGQSEEILGRGLKGWPRAPRRVGRRRKGFIPSGARAQPGRRISRKRIVQSIDASLRAALQTDYVDLYQIHRFDYASTPTEETIEALRRGREVRQGALHQATWMTR